MEKGYFAIVPIDQIIPGERHLPELPHEIQEELQKSISKFGLLQPLIVLKQDTGYLLVSGFSRYEAALKLKKREVPCLIKEGI